MKMEDQLTRQHGMKGSFHRGSAESFAFFSAFAENSGVGRFNVLVRGHLAGLAKKFPSPHRGHSLSFADGVQAEARGFNPEETRAFDGEIPSKALSPQGDAATD